MIFPLHTFKDEKRHVSALHRDLHQRHSLVRFPQQLWSTCGMCADTQKTVWDCSGSIKFSYFKRPPPPSAQVNLLNGWPDLQEKGSDRMSLKDKAWELMTPFCSLKLPNVMDAVFYSTHTEVIFIFSAASRAQNLCKWSAKGHVCLVILFLSRRHFKTKGKKIWTDLKLENKQYNWGRNVLRFITGFCVQTNRTRHPVCLLKTAALGLCAVPTAYTDCSFSIGPTHAEHKPLLQGSGLCQGGSSAPLEQHVVYDQHHCISRTKYAVPAV